MLTSELGYPTRVLMDTHIWVWAALGETRKVKPGLFDALEEAARDERLFVSSASVWEIALKVAKGDILVAGDVRSWVREQEKAPGVRIWPLSVSVLIEMTRLPRWIRSADGKEHRDPNDRFLVTTARRRRAVLATCDAEILAYAQRDCVDAYDARP